MKILKRYTVITFGCTIYAAGFALFLEPANLAAGGASGIAVIITHFFSKIDSGTVIFMINLPLLIIGASVFGGKFFFGTIWATVASSGIISLIDRLMTTVLTDDILCNALSGALLTGVGMGFVFRENATTGGTDIVVRLIQRKVPHLKTGSIFLIVDSAIVITAGIVFKDIETAVYSGLTLAANTLIFNYVLYGGMRAKLVIIIAEEADNLSKKLSAETGVTLLNGRGAYTNKPVSVLICAVEKRKYPAVRTLTNQISPNAIVITAPAEDHTIC